MSKHASVWLALFICLLARPAYAYLDPASGSLLVQLIVGGLAGLSVLARLFWKRITSAFKRGSRRSNGAATSDHQ